MARWGTFLAVLLIALGVLAGEEALAQGGLIAMPPALTRLVEGLDGMRTGGWMIPAGIALVVLGGWLIHRALRRSPVVGLALTGSDGGYVTTRGVARIAADAAGDVSGVLNADARATLRRVTVDYRGTGGEEIAEHVRSAVAARIAPLEQPPTIRTSGGDRR